MNDPVSPAQVFTKYTGYRNLRSLHLDRDGDHHSVFLRLEHQTDKKALSLVFENVTELRLAGFDGYLYQIDIPSIERAGDRWQFKDIGFEGSKPETLSLEFEWLSVQMVED